MWEENDCQFKNGNNDEKVIQGLRAVKKTKTNKLWN